MIHVEEVQSWCSAKPSGESTLPPLAPPPSYQCLNSPLRITENVQEIE